MIMEVFEFTFIIYDPLTQPGPVARSAILWPPAGNRTLDPANLVQRSAN